MAKTNPLDAFVTTRPGSWPRDFRVPQLPKLRESVSGKNVLDGLAHADGALEAWRKNFEQSISERLREATATPAATTPAVTPASSSTTVINEARPSPAPVTSVNGQIGDVQLTTDDIPEGTVNFYLTAARWLQLFDTLGFHKNRIDFGEAILIPAERNLVMYGPLTIDGLLVIDGYFINLTP